MSGLMRSLGSKRGVLQLGDRAVAIGLLFEYGALHLLQIPAPPCRQTRFVRRWWWRRYGRVHRTRYAYPAHAPLTSMAPTFTAKEFAFASLSQAPVAPVLIYSGRALTRAAAARGTDRSYVVAHGEGEATKAQPSNSRVLSARQGPRPLVRMMVNSEPAPAWP